MTFLQSATKQEEEFIGTIKTVNNQILVEYEKGDRFHIRYDSPRTINAYQSLGIHPSYLEYKTFDSFGGKQVLPQIQKLRFQHYQKCFAKTIKKIYEQRRQTILQERAASKEIDTSELASQSQPDETKYGFSKSFTRSFSQKMNTLNMQQNSQRTFTNQMLSNRYFLDKHMSKSVYSNPEYYEKVEEINKKNKKYMQVKERQAFGTYDFERTRIKVLRKLSSKYDSIEQKEQKDEKDRLKMIKSASEIYNHKQENYRQKQKDIRIAGQKQVRAKLEAIVQKKKKILELDQEKSEAIRKLNEDKMNKTQTFLVEQKKTLIILLDEIEQSIKDRHLYSQQLYEENLENIRIRLLQVFQRNKEIYLKAHEQEMKKFNMDVNSSIRQMDNFESYMLGLSKTRESQLNSTRESFKSRFENNVNNRKIVMQIQREKVKKIKDMLLRQEKHVQEKNRADELLLLERIENNILCEMEVEENHQRQLRIMEMKSLDLLEKAAVKKEQMMIFEHQKKLLQDYRIMQKIELQQEENKLHEVVLTATHMLNDQQRMQKWEEQVKINEKKKEANKNQQQQQQQQQSTTLRDDQKIMKKIITDEKLLKLLELTFQQQDEIKSQKKKIDPI